VAAMLQGTPSISFQESLALDQPITPGKSICTGAQIYIQSEVMRMVGVRER